MTHRWQTALSLSLALVAAGAVGATLPVTRVTDDALDLLGGGASLKRDPFTSRGQILFADQNKNVWLYTGTLPPSIVQAAPGGDDSVADHVFMLGTAAAAGQVLAGWRRGNGYGLVSVNGGAPQTVTLNPEAVSVADGCIFMVLQTAAAGNHAFQIDPATGAMTQLSSGTLGANQGAFRIASSGCKAAWTFQPASGDPFQVQYWNGTTTTLLEPDASMPRMAGGWIAYTKDVAGVAQVFAVDASDPLLAPVQLSAEDGTKPISHVETDGRHVIWMRGTVGVDAELVLAGGLVFPTGALGVFSNERGVQLQRGQLLWKAQGGDLFYFDGIRTHAIDPAPATTVEVPWLADGYIAFLGLHEDGGTDKEVFRITGTDPADTAQPSPPLYVKLTPGAGSITVEWDRVLGADSYNLYLANEPGVTKDNYASLAGGVKISGVTSPHVLSSLPTNRSYFVAISAVDGGTEGLSSRRPASTVLPGTLAWTPVGPAATSFYSVAADPTDGSFVYAGSGGSIYRSANGGIEWSEEATAATTGANRIAAIAADGARVFAAAMDEGDVWSSVNDGADWTRTLDATNPGELNGSVAIDPSNGDKVYAGDFVLPSKVSGDSYVIRSITGGASWSHTPEGPDLGDEIHAYALAIDPNETSTLFAGGSGTPNLARSVDGGSSWAFAGVPGFGGVYSVAVDPRDSSVVYATVQHRGVFKSRDGGTTWTAANGGLTGVSPNNFGGAGFHSILVDPQNSDYLHLGAGNGYWYSIDGGVSWTAANVGFIGGPAWIYALALTPDRRLFAATDAGLYLLSLAPAPVVASVLPATGDAGGGTSVTISGSGFQEGAAVAFDGAAATSVVVVDSSTIAATTPAGEVGPADVVITNFDGQSGTGTAAFTYTTTPPPAPSGVVATAQSATSVAVSWNATPRATSYGLFRRGSTGVWESVGTTSTTSLTDGTAAATTSYFYRVQASNSAGTSPDSVADLATTVVFSDDPLIVNVTTVRAVHLAECRAAVNAVRQLASLGAASFTGAAAAGVLIDDAHVTEMRTALDAARDLLGLSIGGYTDGALAGIAVKAAHFQEIRERVK